MLEPSVSDSEFLRYQRGNSKATFNREIYFLYKKLIEEIDQEYSS
jgi:hypothetical protein